MNPADAVAERTAVIVAGGGGTTTTAVVLLNAAGSLPTSSRGS
jgi:hypothetical protein